jgi:hypothetical protein
MKKDPYDSVEKRKVEQVKELLEVMNEGDLKTHRWNGGS